MWPYCRSDQIEGIFGLGAPSHEGLIHGVLERLITAFRWDDGSTEHPHTLDIDMLALYIDGPHIYVALHAHEVAGRGGRYSMLTGTFLGDDPMLTHLLGQKDLTEGIIDLVCSRVIKIFTLEVDLRTISFAQTAGMVEGAGSTYVVT